MDIIFEALACPPAHHLPPVGPVPRLLQPHHLLLDERQGRHACRDSVTRFVTSILPHLGSLFRCYSIFAYGFDFLEIFSYVNNSAVSLTPQNQAHLKGGVTHYIYAIFQRFFFSALKREKKLQFFIMKAHLDP